MASEEQMEKKADTPLPVHVHVTHTLTVVMRNRKN